MLNLAANATAIIKRRSSCLTNKEQNLVNLNMYLLFQAAASISRRPESMLTQLQFQSLSEFQDKKKTKYADMIGWPAFHIFNRLCWFHAVETRQKKKKVVGVDAEGFVLCVPGWTWFQGLFQGDAGTYEVGKKNCLTQSDPWPHYHKRQALCLVLFTFW